MCVCTLAGDKCNNAQKLVTFRRELLGMSGGIEEIGSIQWQVALCLLLAWTLTFLALSKGVKSVGKVSFWLDPLPSSTLARDFRSFSRASF